MLTLVEDLEADLRSANSLLIVGSGVSIAATGGHPTASWNGLLLDGIAYCVEKMRSLSANEAAALRHQLAHDDVAERIQVAHTVQQKLGADLLRWLTEAIGTLPIKDRAVLDAVHAIGTRIATTNYDGLLEHGRDLAPIRVTDPNKTLQFLRGTRNGILHLHGYWDDEPPSVVLGTESYERLVSNEVAQFLQRAIAARYTVVFVGCGDGMSDPNLGPLLRWMSEALRETIFRNYVLCRDQDVDPLRAHGLDAIRYVSYGGRYEDLETFLRLLRTDSSISVQKPEQAVITDEIGPSSTTAAARQKSQVSGRKPSGRWRLMRLPLIALVIVALGTTGWGLYKYMIKTPIGDPPASSTTTTKNFADGTTQGTPGDLFSRYNATLVPESRLRLPPVDMAQQLCIVSALKRAEDIGGRLDIPNLRQSLNQCAATSKPPRGPSRIIASVQALLNERARSSGCPLEPLDIDGIIGFRTTDAIQIYSKCDASPLREIERLDTLGDYATLGDYVTSESASSMREDDQRGRNGRALLKDCVSPRQAAPRFIDCARLK
jgi:hypothetical protein